MRRIVHALDTGGGAACYNHDTSSLDRFQTQPKWEISADKIWDKSQRAYVTRQLTIIGSDRYGLPTALDDEVILGLIQASASQALVTPHLEANWLSCPSLS